MNGISTQQYNATTGQYFYSGLTDPITQGIFQVGNLPGREGSLVLKDPLSAPTAPGPPPHGVASSQHFLRPSHGLTSALNSLTQDVQNSLTMAVASQGGTPSGSSTTSTTPSGSATPAAALPLFNAWAYVGESSFTPPRVVFHTHSHPFTPTRLLSVLLTPLYFEPIAWACAGSVRGGMSAAANGHLLNLTALIVLSDLDLNKPMVQGIASSSPPSVIVSRTDFIQCHISFGHGTTHLY